MVEKKLNNTTPYGKIWASHEGALHSSTLILKQRRNNQTNNQNETKIKQKYYNQCNINKHFIIKMDD